MKRETIVHLNNTRQKLSEGLVDFVYCFHDLVLDCDNKQDDGVLMDICVYLEYNTLKNWE